MKRAERGKKRAETEGSRGETHTPQRQADRQVSGLHLQPLAGPGCTLHLGYKRHHCVGIMSPFTHLAWDAAVSYNQRKAMIPGGKRNKPSGAGVPATAS